MTTDDIAKLRSEITQPAPWMVVDAGHGRCIVVDDNGLWVADVGEAPKDAAFIAAAPEIVAFLLDEVERLQKQVKIDAVVREHSIARIPEQARIKERLDLIEPVFEAARRYARDLADDIDPSRSCEALCVAVTDAMERSDG